MRFHHSLQRVAGRVQGVIRDLREHGLTLDDGVFTACGFNYRNLRDSRTTPVTHPVLSTSFLLLPFFGLFFTRGFYKLLV